MFIWCGRGCNPLYSTIEGLQWVKGVVRCAPHCAGDLEYLLCLISSSTYSSHSRQVSQQSLVALYKLVVHTITRCSYNRQLPLQSMCPYNRQMSQQSIGVPIIASCPILASSSYNRQLPLQQIGVPTIARCSYNRQVSTQCQLPLQLLVALYQLGPVTYMFYVVYHEHLYPLYTGVRMRELL